MVIKNHRVEDLLELLCKLIIGGRGYNYCICYDSVERDYRIRVDAVDGRHAQFRIRDVVESVHPDEVISILTYKISQVVNDLERLKPKVWKEIGRVK